MELTQTQTIKFMLERETWVCGSEFLAKYISEYRSRINVLRKSGTNVFATKCTIHKHKGGTQMWSLQPMIGQNNETCPDCNVWLNHSPNCITLQVTKSNQLNF